MIKIHSAFDLPPKVLIDTSIEPPVTKQSFKDECDINVLMSRYERSGILDFVNENEPYYGDISPIDFQEAMNIVAKGQSMFEAMPAKLRTRFDNRPEKFLEFIQNDSNRAEAISLGLVNPPVPSTSEVSPETPPEPPKAAS